MGIPKRGLQSWGARQWRFAEMQKFYDERLVDKYDRVWGIPLRRKHGSDQVKVALDVGGGAGGFAVARDEFEDRAITAAAPPNRFCDVKLPRPSFRYVLRLRFLKTSKGKALWI